MQHKTIAAYKNDRHNRAVAARKKTAKRKVHNKMALESRKAQRA